MDRDGILNWLLEEGNPPVRLLTLTHLLHRPETDPEVQDARARLMQYSVTQGILAHGEQFWPDDDGAYSKYTGQYWQAIFLGQSLADGRDPRIARGVRDLLAHRKWISQVGGQCLTANLLTAFRRLGYGAHPVVMEETEALAAVGVPMSGALEKPLEVIHDKRTADGVWRLENSLNGRMWVDVEVKGQPSKWITLFAYMVLDHFG